MGNFKRVHEHVRVCVCVCVRTSKLTRRSFITDTGEMRQETSVTADYYLCH